MRRITQWDKAPSWPGRIVDPLRTRMPIPRYLRHSPLRAMRERLWFVSQMQPTVLVNVNVNVSPKPAAGTVPATVFLDRWLAARTAEPKGVREQARRPEGPVIGSRMEVVTRRILGRYTASPAHLELPTVQRPPLDSPDPTLVSVAAAILVPMLTRRGRRIDTLTAQAPAQVVKSHAVAKTDGPAAMLPRPSGLPAKEHASSFGLTDAARSAAQPIAIDTERITDQVLRQLDRRLIASRERMGRI